MVDCGSGCSYGDYPMVLAQDERLVEFSFSSRLDSGLSSESMLRLACQSWSANRRAGTSGFMRFDGHSLEQTIEGASTRILSLAAQILTDRRHCEIRITRFCPISQRRFADWRIFGFAAHPPDAAGAAAPRRGLRLLTGEGGAADLDKLPELALALAT
jgi:hypothetical protein